MFEFFRKLRKRMSPRHSPRQCHYCHGRFGLISRWNAGNKFCSLKCAEEYQHELVFKEKQRKFFEFLSKRK